jgi:hypothetical protein
MSDDLDVWQDVQFNHEGVSVTTYSQAPDESAVVEDETWYTWAEMLDKMHEHATFANTEQVED